MDINKFDKFIKLMNESYDSPVDINWINNSNTELDGEFLINDIRYLIECTEWDNNIWSYKFSRIDNDEKIMDLVNDNKNKMYVLATIREGMRYLIENKEPNALIINVMDGSKGRDNLWRRFSLEISEKYNYNYKNTEVMGTSNFFLYKNIDFEDVQKSFDYTQMIPYICIHKRSS